MAQENLKVTISLLDRISKPLKGIRGSVVGLSNQITAATTQMRGGFQLAVGAGLGLVGVLAPAFLLEDALSRVGVTGKDTNKTLDEIRNSAFRLNAQFGQGLRETVAALKESRQLTRLTGDDLERSAAAGILLNRQFSDIQRNKVFAVQAQLVRDFKLGVGEASDVIASLVSRGGDLRGELLDALLEYSGQFKELGFDIGQTVSMTQVALDRGWNVDKLLDAVKEGGIKLREMNKDQVQMLGVLGLSHLVPRIKAGEVAIADVMKRIGVRVKTLGNDTARFNVMSKIFGAPAEDAGVGPMIAMLEAIGKSPKVKGTMDELTALWQKSPIALMLRMRGELENMAAAFGSLLLPVLIPVVEEATAFTKQMRMWMGVYPQLSKLIGHSVLAVLALALGMAALNFLFGALRFAMIPLLILLRSYRILLWAINAVLLITRVAMLAFAGAMLISRNASWAMTAGFFLAKGALLAFSAVMLLGSLAMSALTFAAGLLGSALLFLFFNPIGLVILGIVLLIGAVIAGIFYWKEIRAAIISVAEWFAKLPGPIKLLIGAFAPFIAIPLLLINYWEDFKGVLKSVWEFVQPIMGPIIRAAQALASIFGFTSKGKAGVLPVAAPAPTQVDRSISERLRPRPETARGDVRRAIGNAANSTDNRKQIIIQRLALEFKEKPTPDGMRRMLLAIDG